MDNKHQSYKRIHTYKYERDVEQGKIQKEKHNVRKIKKQQQKLLHNIISSPEEIDEALLEEYEETIYFEKKERKNASTHKNRLKDLIKNKTID